MKFFKLELKCKAYTSYLLDLIEIETGEIIAVFQTSTIDKIELERMVSHLVKYLYHKDFALVFKLEEKEKKNG